jgi:hypothetical protein
MIKELDYVHHMSFFAKDEVFHQLHELLKKYEFRLISQGKHQNFKLFVYSSKDHGSLRSFEFRRFRNLRYFYITSNELIVEGEVSRECKKEVSNTVIPETKYPWKL